MRNTRLAGHGLKSEGEPYERRHGRWARAYSRSRGRALCKCGETSAVLDTDAARKRWHRDVHKPEMRAAGR